MQLSLATFFVMSHFPEMESMGMDKNASVPTGQTNDQIRPVIQMMSAETRESRVHHNLKQNMRDACLYRAVGKRPFWIGSLSQVSEIRELQRSSA